MGEPQVLIVGAGPTGLALALWLATSGTPFRLIDRKGGPDEGSRAMAVQARTLEFYRQLGVADDVIAGGFRLDRLHLRNESREIAAVPLGDVGKGLSPYPFALSFPQDDHKRLLMDRLRAAGHAVEWDTELTGFTQQEGGVRADPGQCAVVHAAPAGERRGLLQRLADMFRASLGGVVQQRLELHLRRILDGVAAPAKVFGFRVSGL
ncbi:MAG TPA: FAD-dependent monooxygenase [Gemmataceae bacterium]|nr:FAD-dependent monooxygenase [Gemmataceae bacterium]